ncbi:MAG TPA: hypothetical protein VGM95_01145 [Lactobacillaceae bacterium]
MSTYYLRPQLHMDHGINLVFDAQFQAVYLLDATHASHQIGGYYLLADMRGRELARIIQTSAGILPRFVLQLNGVDMGAFTLTLAAIGDLVYIRRLNWLISGNTLTNRYVITHNTQKLLGVKPTRRPDGIYLRLQVTNDDEAPLHILIAAFLNRISIARLPNFQAKTLSTR